MDVFYALSEPRRRRVIEVLASRGQLCAKQICDEFDVTPQAISQHLKVLREANLVSMEKKAQKRIYTINLEPVAKMERWTEEITNLWSTRFAALEEALQRERPEAHNTSGQKANPD